MNPKQKYQPVLDLGESLQVSNGDVQESEGKLTIKGTVVTAYEKNLIWDKIKEIGGAEPKDIEADIRYTEQGYYARHEVKKGDTLYKIAEHYYGKGKGMQYKAIHQANLDVIGNNPDVIHPGQLLILPMPS